MWRVRNRLSDDEQGFTLVEVMVSLIVFMLFSTAAFGMLIGAVRTAAVNKSSTIARGIAQNDMEALRGLVFQAASGQTLLSTYYPSATGSAVRGTTGYVPSAGYTADGDPASGAFYRTVLPQGTLPSGYTRYVTIQFTNGSGGAITPTSTYLATAIPLPSQTVRATVTVIWTTAGSHRFTVQSELTTGRATAVRSSAQARMTAVRLSGLSTTGGKVSVEGPTITVDASLSDNAIAAVTAKGVEGVISTGGRVSGASGVANAPADETAATTSGSAGSLTANGLTYATYGPSATSGLSAMASYATPLVSTSASPATTTLSSSGGTSALTMTTLDAISSAPPKLQLSSATVAAATQPACGGNCVAFSSTGWLSSSDNGATHAIDATVGSVGSGGIGLFPTSFAPAGVVVVTLTSASLTCHAGATYGGSPSVSSTPTYSATVKYWKYNPATNTGGYQSVTVSQNDASSPLPALLSTQVGSYLGSPVYLSDYISSWNSSTAGSLTAKQQVASTNKSIAAPVDGFVSIDTVGLRLLDPSSSSLSAQLGVASCATTDVR